MCGELNYKIEYERQEDYINKLQCKCEELNKTLVDYENKIKKLKKKNKKLKIIEEQLNIIKKYFRIERTSLKEKEDKYEIDVILESGEETTIYTDEEIIKNGDNFVFNTIMSSIHVTIMNGHCDKVLL